MLLGNVEADELLMQSCMRVGKRKYFVEHPSGSTYPLTDKYRTNGRFDRFKVKAMMKRLGKIELDDYNIMCEVAYTGTEQLAIGLMEQQIKKLYYMTKVSRLDFFIGSTDKSNFRFAAAKTLPYKGDRGEKPSIIPYLRQYLLLKHNAVEAHGYEADDMLGINQGKDTIAIHCDKDINQIPGAHYNTMTDTLWQAYDPGTLTKKKSGIDGHGLAFFYAQLLMGDKTDNIPSIKKSPTIKTGWGGAGVYQLLRNCKEEREYLDIVVNCYKEVLENNWQARLKEQADLVWICRSRKQTGKDYITQKLKEHKL